MIHTDRTDDSNIGTILKELVETCKDGERGFRTAAEAVPNEELATLFLNYSEQRAEFAAELEAEARRIGGEPETGAALEPLHRGWVDIQAVGEGKDEGAIISEAERGEDNAVKTYRAALEKNLPTAVQTIVEHQYIHVRDAHDHIRALEQLHTERSAHKVS